MAGEQKRKRSELDAPGDSVERAEHHYVVRLGDEFDNARYHVVEQLGKGTFGRVVEMWDRVDRRAVAVKIIRSVEK